VTVDPAETVQRLPSTADQLENLVRRQKAEIVTLKAQLAALDHPPGEDGDRRSAAPPKTAGDPRSGGAAGLDWLPIPILRRVLDMAWVRERNRVVRRFGRFSEVPDALVLLLDLSEYDWFRRDQAAAGSGGAPKCDGGLCISVILPVCQIGARVLRATLMSLKRQTYRNWEACIVYAGPADAPALKLLKTFARRDSRFRLKVLDRNHGISGNSNAALEMATGEFIALLDHDDELAPSAFASVVEALAEQPDIDFVYTDRDLVSEDSSRRFKPLLKPSWSPEMLYAVNYLTHLNVIRRDLVIAVGGWSLGVDGSQDWDLFLKVSERTSRILHLPHIAYSWRVHPASAASGLAAKPYAEAAQLVALQRHARRTGIPGRFKARDTNYCIVWDHAPCSDLVVFVARKPGWTAALLVHLADHRDSFSQVHLVGSEAELAAVDDALRGACAARPSWLKLSPIPQRCELPAALAELVSALTAPTVVFLDGAGMVLTPGALDQLSGWLYEGSSIRFASGVAVLDGDIVVEAGCVRDELGVVHPLFRGEHLLPWTPFGGPLWRRNVETASPYILAMRSRDAAAALRRVANGGVQQVLQAACLALVNDGANGRGVVEPVARVLLQGGGAYPPPAQGSIGDCGRYFHPALAIAPSGKIVFRAAARVA
jgi:glycosyltransferase involved in cell wall biosynthesis